MDMQDGRTNVGSSDGVDALVLTQGPFLHDMYQVVDKYLSQCGRRWVELKSLFSFMKVVVVAFSAVGIALSYILQTFLSISRSVACYFLLYNRLLSVQIHHVETPQHTFSASSTRHFESRPSMVVYFRRWYRRGSKSLDRASTSLDSRNEKFGHRPAGAGLFIGRFAKCM